MPKAKEGPRVKTPLLLRNAALAPPQGLVRKREVARVAPREGAFVIDWDPFADVDLDEADDPEVVRERAIARARTLDPRVALCKDCGKETEDWIVREGLGEGLCRACVVLREDAKDHARAFSRLFREALEALQKLRAERAERIKKETRDVPF